MTSLSLGDMAQAQILRRATANTQTRLSTLAEELSSGRKADTAKAAGGDFKILASIERSLAALESYATATEEAALAGSGIQIALETVQTSAAESGGNFVSAGTTGTATVVDATASTARPAVDAAVAALNTEIGGRYLLSGAATDRKPLTGAGDILAALQTATAGMTTATDVMTAVRDWFDAPPGGGGFLDLAYGGSALAGGPMPLGDGTTAHFDVTAADAEVRRTLEGLALGALVGSGTLAGDPAARALVLRSAGETLLSAGSDLAATRGRVGTVEAAIEAAATRNETEGAALEIARSRIVSADPYDTATALEEARGQLETLYALTARLSRLSLVEYL